MKSLFSAVALGLTLTVSLPAVAAAEEGVEPRVQSTSLSFSGGRGFTNAVLRVYGPNDYEKEETAASGLPIFRLQTAGRLVDGFYTYTLLAASDEEVAVDTSVDNGRGEAQKTTMKKPFALYGQFMVKEGLLTSVEDAATEEGEKG